MMTIVGGPPSSAVTIEVRPPAGTASRKAGCPASRRLQPHNDGGIHPVICPSCCSAKVAMSPFDGMALSANSLGRRNSASWPWLVKKTSCPA